MSTEQDFRHAPAFVFGLKRGSSLPAATLPPVPDVLAYEIVDDHVVITACDKEAETVVIPAEIEGKPVTEIGDKAFLNCRELQSIEIPDSITAIGNSAFYGCSKLTDIMLPASVTTIGATAFYGCRLLRSIAIPGSITTIYSYAFENCRRLTNIVITDGVTKIGNSAFAACDAMTSVTIPASVTAIGDNAFSGCPLRDFYYTGTVAQWSAVSVGPGNDALYSAVHHFEA